MRGKSVSRKCIETRICIISFVLAYELFYWNDSLVTHSHLNWDINAISTITLKENLIVKCFFSSSCTKFCRHYWWLKSQFHSIRYELPKYNQWSLTVSNRYKSQKFSEWKQADVGIEFSKTNQTRLEWPHNTFTPSLHLLPFCCHLHK